MAVWTYEGPLEACRRRVSVAESWCNGDPKGRFFLPDEALPESIEALSQYVLKGFLVHDCSKPT